MATSLRKEFLRQIATLDKRDPATANPLLLGLKKFRWTKNTSLDHPDLLYAFSDNATFSAPADSNEVRLRYTEHYTEYYEALEKLAVVAVLDLSLPGEVTVHRNRESQPSTLCSAWATELLVPAGEYAHLLGADLGVAIVVTGSVFRTEDGASLSFKLELFALKKHPSDGTLQVVEVLK
jgi:hypothetical protein